MTAKCLTSFRKMAKCEKTVLHQVKDGTPSGRKWWFQTYGQAVKFYEKKVDAGKPIHSLRELAKQIDSGYKRIEIMVDQKLKEVGIE